MLIKAAWLPRNLSSVSVRTFVLFHLISVLVSVPLRQKVTVPQHLNTGEKCPLATLYDVEQIYIHANERQETEETAAWTINRDTTRVHIVHQVSPDYLDALQSLDRVPRVAGVAAAYHFLKSALIEQQEHVLLAGPVGVGKASLVRRAAAELGRPLLVQDCGDLGGAVGESGEGLNQLFATAIRVAGETLFDGDGEKKKGCVVLLENVEALGGRQSGGLGGGPGLLARCLERWPGCKVAGPGRLEAGPASLEAGPGRQVAGPGRLEAGPGRLEVGPGRLAAGPASLEAGPGRLTVICTTSRPEEVDSSLRRPGRLGLEFTMKVKMFYILCRSVLDPSPDPHVFGPSGSGSISQRYGSGSF
jgi:hypothetical protein